MRIDSLLEHKSYDISDLTEEYIYNSLAKDEAVIELYFTTDFNKIDNHYISFAFVIKADNFRKIYSIHMGSKTSNEITINHNDHVTIYIDNDTFESDFYALRMEDGSDQVFKKCDRVYPKYWEETGMKDLSIRAENALRKICIEMKDVPIGTHSTEYWRYKND